MKKTLLATLIVGMTLTGAAGVYAGTKLEKISAYLNHEIAFQVDGEARNVTDGNGKQLAPITYQNITYVPIRAVSQMVGADVSFDSARHTVVIGTGKKGNSEVHALTKVNYSPAQIKEIKSAYAKFESFETAYAPEQMTQSDSYVKTAATGDGVNHIFKHMVVNVSPRDYSNGYDAKEVTLANGVKAKWYTPSDTPMLSYQLDDRTVMISSPDHTLSKAQIEQVAVHVAKLK